MSSLSKSLCRMVSASSNTISSLDLPEPPLAILGCTSMMVATSLLVSSTYIILNIYHMLFSSISTLKYRHRDISVFHAYGKVQIFSTSHMVRKFAEFIFATLIVSQKYKTVSDRVFIWQSETTEYHRL